MPVAIAIGVAGVATAGATVYASSASKKAATIQAQGIDQATALQRDIYTQGRADLAPWRAAGGNALERLQDALGMNGPEGKARATGSFQTGPGYEFAFGEGQRAVTGSKAARGMLKSGSTLKALTRFGEGTANQEWGSWVNNLKALAGLGETANAQTQQGAQAFATNAGNLMSDAAAARASGYVGSANAYTSGANNLAMLAGNFGGGGGSGWGPYYAGLSLPNVNVTPRVQ